MQMEEAGDRAARVNDADPDSGRTALHWAAAAGRLEVAS